mmetsp:Transcript_4024/g.13467  ORF Transcript_4024/g.13467 Transcript_4024/m.13467 type:complete len:213 (+) Transcript_4024:2897-3535(+)
MIPAKPSGFFSVIAAAAASCATVDVPYSNASSSSSSSAAPGVDGAGGASSTFARLPMILVADLARFPFDFSVTSSSSLSSSFSSSGSGNNSVAAGSSFGVNFTNKESPIRLPRNNKSRASKHIPDESTAPPARCNIMRFKCRPSVCNANKSNAPVFVVTSTRSSETTAACAPSRVNSNPQSMARAAHLGGGFAIASVPIPAARACASASLPS